LWPPMVVFNELIKFNNLDGRPPPPPREVNGYRMTHHKHRSCEVQYLQYDGRLVS
jgi:hypothetical protein